MSLPRPKGWDGEDGVLTMQADNPGMALATMMETLEDGDIILSPPGVN
ncbi:MAG: hypothetical protein R6W89_04730 [Candidatus Hydrogenedentota bacterium]